MIHLKKIRRTKPVWPVTFEMFAQLVGIDLVTAKQILEHCSPIGTVPGRSFKVPQKSNGIGRSGTLEIIAADFGFDLSLLKTRCRLVKPIGMTTEKIPIPTYDCKTVFQKMLKPEAKQLVYDLREASKFVPKAPIVPRLKITPKFVYL